ncbi:probable potassium transporter 17 [Tanacetum coccineum]
MAVPFLLKEVPGSEALFADLGHFDRRSIQIAFLSFIYPSLVLTYAGQTAYLIQNPNHHDDGLYKFIPTKLYWPMSVIASLAAIVSSQSLISATFSVIKQSVVLDYFPRIKIVHTSSGNEGQVYSPETNYTLMVLCVAVIYLFLGMEKKLETPLSCSLPVYHSITNIGYDRNLENPLSSRCSLLFHLLDNGRLLPELCIHQNERRQRQMEYELTHKIDIDRLKLLLSATRVSKGFSDSASFTPTFKIGSYKYIMQYSNENPKADPLEEQEMIDLNEAQDAAVVHVRGKSRFYISKNCTWFDRFMLAFYEFTHSNCRSGIPTLGVPLPQRKRSVHFEALEQGGAFVKKSY